MSSRWSDQAGRNLPCRLPAERQDKRLCDDGGQDRGDYYDLKEIFVNDLNTIFKNKYEDNDGIMTLGQFKELLNDSIDKLFEEGY